MLRIIKPVKGRDQGKKEKGFNVKVMVLFYYLAGAGLGYMVYWLQR